MSKLATIQQIHSIDVHPNADLLLVARILGWPVVIKKDAGFKDGDLVVFFAIDSIVDSTNPYFAFLEKQGYRIRNSRFRQMPSSGLVCPLSILDYYGVDKNIMVEGRDVSTETKVVKYERVLDQKITGESVGWFPKDIISITDEDNFLANIRCIDEFLGENCYTAVKADGSSGTIIYQNGEIKVCSRRLELRDGDSGWWRTVKKYNLPEKLKSRGQDLAIQFELCGPGIQGNPMGLSELDIFVFTVKDLATGEYYGLEKIRAICKELEIPMVTIIEEFKWTDEWNIDRLRDVADNVKYPNGKVGEGCVIRPVTPKYSPKLGKMLSCAGL